MSDHTLCKDCRKAEITWEEYARFGGLCALCTAPYAVRSGAFYHGGAQGWVLSEHRAMTFPTRRQAEYVVECIGPGRKPTPQVVDLRVDSFYRMGIS